MTLVAIEEAKLQCHLEADFTEEDAYLQILTDAAINKVENDINKKIVDSTSTTSDGELKMTSAIKMAVLLLIGHWYTNREAVVTGTISTALPLAYESLINSYRDIAVG